MSNVKADSHQIQWTASTQRFLFVYGRNATVHCGIRTSVNEPNQVQGEIKLKYKVSFRFNLTSELQNDLTERQLLLPSCPIYGITNRQAPSKMPLERTLAKNFFGCSLQSAIHNCALKCGMFWRLQITSLANFVNALRL